MKVQLIAYTPDTEKVVASAAKLCYSSAGVDKIQEDLTEERINSFLDMLTSLGHESPVEHVSFTFAIEGISRACSHQLVRHRIASYCLSGDTIVYTDMSNRSVKERTIKDLYEMKQQYLNMTYLRCIDEETKNICKNKIKSIVYSGKKEVYSVTTRLGYTIKSTLKHRFLTEDGWKQLQDIKVCDKVYVNKLEHYKDRELLEREYYNENIAVVLDEIISIEYVGIEDTYDIEMFEPYHNFIANGFVVHNSQQSQRYVSMNNFDYIMPPSIAKYSGSAAIYEDIMDYLQKHYTSLSVDLMMDKLIEEFGEEFKDFLNEKLGDSWYISNTTEFKSMLKGTKFYNKGVLFEKEAIEDARYILPNACETKIVVTMNARSLLNFFSHRCCNRAQWEIHELADKMLQEVKKVAPTLFKYAGPPCLKGKCPEGKMSCGLMKDVIDKYKNI